MTNKASNLISTNTHSKLKRKPDGPDWLYENIAETTKNARKIYFMYVGFLIYCLLTVADTSDREIILNGMVHLPLVNLDISLNWFFILAPLLAIFMFVYLQFYLNRMKSRINYLKANYTPQKERSYPWMLYYTEDHEEDTIGIVRAILVKLSLWWLLPVVLGFFAFWFVKKHDPFFSYIVGIIPILGAVIVLLFWSNYESSPVKNISIRKNIGKIVLIILVIIFEVSLLCFIIPRANYLEFFCVDLSYQKLVTEPETEYKEICWVDLKGAHLEGSIFVSTVLKRADLRDAHLQGAKMSRVNLQEADLQGANLIGTDLKGANLQSAKLFGARFESAKLEMANLKNVDFRPPLAPWREKLVSLFISLERGNLKGADLWGANLQEAILRGVNLQDTQLQEANFFKADLRETDLMGAKLHKANLQEADIRKARTLTVEQIREVKTLYNTKLDPELRKQIEEKYPDLLKKPKPEKEEKEENV